MIPVAQSAKMIGACGFVGPGGKQPWGLRSDTLEDGSPGIASGPFNTGVFGKASVIGFARRRRRTAGFISEH